MTKPETQPDDAVGPPIASDEDIKAERARVAQALLDVANDAQQQYQTLLKDKPEHSSTASLLRARSDALVKYARLKVLERPVQGLGEWIDRAEDNVLPGWAIADDEYDD